MDRDELKKKRIGVLLGGLSVEREISLQSGAAVEEALRRRGYQTVRVDVGRGLPSKLVQADVEVAFLVLHGRYGEDGCVQGLLETMGIPYTGSGVLASAIAMDKVQSKRLFAAVGLPTPRWCHPASIEGVKALGLPVVIKPRGEGSSVGVQIIHDQNDVADAIERAGGPDSMAERYVPGRELTVGVLGHGAASRCLSSLEVRPAEGMYDYEAKYNREDTEYIVPAPVPDPLQRTLAELALNAHRLLGCCGATRTDFVWDGEEDLQLLEVNTIPGMTDHSLLPKIAGHAGLSYDDLVEAMLEDARLKT